MQDLVLLSMIFLGEVVQEEKLGLASGGVLQGGLGV